MSETSGAAGSGIVTAALLVIGDEILSGRTKDKNIGYIAEYLTTIGVDLKEGKFFHDRELKGGDRNRATLAVARKLVAYLLAVDKSGKPFEVRNPPAKRAEEVQQVA
jgi:hypothetical protein